MFEQATLTHANASRRALTAGLGFVGEAVLVAFIVLTPIIWPEVLPKPQALLTLLTPPAPVPPAHTTAVKPRIAQAPISRLHFDPSTIPPFIPKQIAVAAEDPPAVVGGIAGPGAAIGDRSGWIDSILGAVRIGPARPVVVTRSETQPRTDSAEPRRVRISSLELARLITGSNPSTRRWQNWPVFRAPWN